MPFSSSDGVTSFLLFNYVPAIHDSPQHVYRCTHTHTPFFEEITCEQIRSFLARIAALDYRLPFSKASLVTFVGTSGLN